MTDVYLSFADKDREAAAGFGTELERRGLTWVGPPRIAGGAYDTGSARRLMEDVTWVVVLLTRHSSPSEWVRHDLDIAFQLGKRIAVLLGPGVPNHHLPERDRILELQPVEEAARLAETIARLTGRWTVGEVPRPVRPAASDAPPPATVPPVQVMPAPAGAATAEQTREKAAPALGDLPAPMDGPGYGRSRSVPDAEYAKRVAADDVPTTVTAAPVPEQPAVRDAEYARRMAKEAVPITAGAAPVAASRDDVPATVGARPLAGAGHRPADTLNDTLSTGTLLAMTAERRAAARPSSVEGGRSQRSLETPDVGAAEPRRRLETLPTWFPPPPPGPPTSARRVNMDEASASQTVLRPSPTPSDGVTPSAGAPVSAGKGLSGLGTFLGVVLAALAVLGVLGGVFGGQDLFGKLLATLKLKLNAFTFFGLFGSGRKPSESEADVVDCSVFAPPAAPPGETVMVQVFLHTAKQAERAQFMASVMDTAAALKGVQTLQTEIRRGARVTVTITAKGLDIDEPQQVIVWRGEPVFAQFLVTLPAGANAATFHPVVRIAVDGGLVGRIAFAIRADVKATMPRSVAAGEEARRYNHAFLSYASADRKEVLKRAQVLKAAGVSFFQDILSLDPGARWEKEIYKHIDGADLFLLFWSKSARDSEWVIREAEYALKRQGSGDVPDIVPVILEGPPVVRPPDSLAAIHFNDQITYLIALS